MDAPALRVDVRRLDVARLVANAVGALEHRMTRLREGFPLCNRLLREMHERLMSRGRGSEKMPGEFRRSQNWIGGTRPGNARVVPPPSTEVESCMAALEACFHDDAAAQGARGHGAEEEPSVRPMAPTWTY